MKITKIDMIYPQAGALIAGEQVPCIWVRVHTDEGITGLGESVYAAKERSDVIYVAYS